MGVFLLNGRRLNDDCFNSGQLDEEKAKEKEKGKYRSGGSYIVQSDGIKRVLEQLHAYAEARFKEQ